MKFYVTTESINRIKKSFLNLKIFNIIDVEEILNKYSYNYSMMNEYEIYIVSSEISSLIESYSKSKRIRGIIYINPYLCTDIIDNLFKTLNDNKYIHEVVLLDDYNVPKLNHYYNKFDEILYFPSFRKIRLVECVNIKDKI